jgi:hypothetical protein
MQTFWQPAPDAPRALDERASEELLWMKNDLVKNHRFRFLVGDGDLSGEARWGRTPGEAPRHRTAPSLSSSVNAIGDCIAPDRKKIAKEMANFSAYYVKCRLHS